MNLVRAGFALAAWAPERATRTVRAKSKQLVRKAVRAGLELTLEELSRADALYPVVDKIVVYLSLHPSKLFGIVDQVAGYLVHHPEVEALIHQQSASLFGAAVEDLREGTARADSALDRVVFSLRRRGKPR